MIRLLRLTINDGSFPKTRGQKLISTWVNSFESFDHFLETYNDKELDIYEPSSTKCAMRPSKIWRRFNTSNPYPHGTFFALESRDGLVYGVTYIVETMHPVESYPVAWSWAPTLCRKV